MGRTKARVNFGLHKTAQEGESEFGEDIVNFLRNDFYVDDGG